MVILIENQGLPGNDIWVRASRHPGRLPSLPLTLRLANQLTIEQGPVLLSVHTTPLYHAIPN